MALSKVYDCFPFFNELELLEIRLSELFDVVDHFIIVEADKTHSGKPKDYVFEKNSKKFLKYSSKIIYHKMAFSPLLSDSWSRERAQRDEILKVLLTKAHDHDTIIISDVDEIPRAEMVKLIKPMLSEKVGVFQMDRFVYYLNMKNTTPSIKELPQNARITSFKVVNKISPCGVRYCDKFDMAETYEIPNGGWHFSFQGGAGAGGAILITYDDAPTNVVLNIITSFGGLSIQYILLTFYYRSYNNVTSAAIDLGVWLEDTGGVYHSINTTVTGVAKNANKEFFSQYLPWRSKLTIKNIWFGYSQEYGDNTKVLEIDEVNLYYNGTNIIPNGDGVGTTDWTDTNNDGIADNWVTSSDRGTNTITTVILDDNAYLFTNRYQKFSVRQQNNCLAMLKSSIT